MLPVTDCRSIRRQTPILVHRRSQPSRACPSPAQSKGGRKGPETGVRTLWQNGSAVGSVICSLLSCPQHSPIKAEPADALLNERFWTEEKKSFLPFMLRSIISNFIRLLCAVRYNMSKLLAWPLTVHSGIRSHVDSADVFHLSKFHDIKSNCSWTDLPKGPTWSEWVRAQRVIKRADYTMQGGCYVRRRTDAQTLRSLSTHGR